MKQAISLVLSLVFAGVSALSALAAGTSYDDVPATAWYAGAVRYVTEKGLMSGTGAGKFSPDIPMTRAMLASVLYRNEGQPPVVDIGAFSDVQGSWYVGAASSRDFADEASIASYAATAVDWARANGIISGKGGNRFDPRGNATRAEIATMMKNYIEYKESAEPTPPTPPTPSGSKTLAVYFSATGSTERVAGYIADELDADTFELIPTTPYTSEDLNWTVSGSRVNREHEDESLRDIDLAANTVENWEDYDTVFIGYPIWWGIAAWPVNNFITANDFTGKTVIPFCTSASSGLGESGQLLAYMAGTGDWQEGQRFSSGASEETVRQWAQSISLN